MLDFLSKGIWGTTFGFFGIIIGLFGLYLYTKSRKGAVPTCFLRGFRLIGRQEPILPKEIDIVFNGSSVPGVALAAGYFWNAGRQTIYKNQLIADDPPRFEFESSSRILRAHIISVTRAVNKFGVDVSGDASNIAKLDFDYLDPGDGACIVILHTSTEKFPKVKGSIRGIPKGIRVLYDEKNTIFHRISSASANKILIASAIFMLIGALFLIGYAISPGPLFHKVLSFLNKEPSTNFGWFLIRVSSLLIGISFLGPIWTLWSQKRTKYPSQLDNEKQDVSPCL